MCISLNGNFDDGDWDELRSPRHTARRAYFSLCRYKISSSVIYLSLVPDTYSLTANPELGVYERTFECVLVRSQRQENYG